jgi:DNA-binding NarL/FixJ family response regulator
MRISGFHADWHTIITGLKNHSNEHAMITVLIADDHPLIRIGICALLENTPDITVVGEAQDGDQALKLVAELHPQILLLDLKMPGVSAASLEKWVRTHHPDTTTLVLTAHDRDAYLAQMVEVGVSGYIDKNVHGNSLVSAIRRAISGEMLFSSDQLERVRRWHKEEGARWASLTRREREVLRLLAKGWGNGKISSALNISMKTVAFHITNILVKLQVASRQEAVAWLEKNIPDDLENPPGKNR